MKKKITPNKEELQQARNVFYLIKELLDINKVKTIDAYAACMTIVAQMSLECGIKEGEAIKTLKQTIKILKHNGEDSRPENP